MQGKVSFSVLLIGGEGVKYTDERIIAVFQKRVYLHTPEEPQGTVIPPSKARRESF